MEPVFKHPDMVLQHEDFVAEVINWESKCVNIRQLAKNLNIGLDSFVFLDDNPAEREQMKAECPEVTVLDFPKDSAQLPELVEKAYQDYFLSLEVTGDNSNKTAMYRAEGQRKADMSAASSVEEFLKNPRPQLEKLNKNITDNLEYYKRVFRPDRIRYIVEKTINFLVNEFKNAYPKLVKNQSTMKKVRLNVCNFVGGVVGLYIHWINGYLDCDISEVSNHLTRVITHVYKGVSIPE